MLLHLVCTVVVGIVVGVIFKKLHFPGGLLVGALVGVAILNIFTNWAYMPKAAKTASQIISGTFIGCTISRDDLKAMSKGIKPLIYLILSLLTLNIAIGFVVKQVSSMDLVTALMSAVPGGLSEIPVIAADMGADSVPVTVMQLGRQILGVAILPALIFTATGREKEEPVKTENEIKQQAVKENRIRKYVITFAVAGVAGVIGSFSGLPGGALVFSLVVVLVLNLGFNVGAIPPKSKVVAQLVNGCYVGSMVTHADVLFLPQVIVPMIILLTCYTAHCFINGYLIHRIFHFKIKDSLLIATPAGASDMVLISADIGVNNPLVIVIQIIRLIIVMIFFPQIIHLLVNFLVV